MKSWLTRLAKQILPASCRNWLKDCWRRTHLIRMLRTIQRQKSPVELDQIRRLVQFWNNVGFSALDEYLLALVDYVGQGSGPILECGSGLSTLLVAVEAQRHGRQLYSLEHHPEWGAKVQSLLTTLGLENAHLAITPLTEFDGFSWYDTRKLSLPKDFTLVICDAPPGDTPGGRFGLLPCLREHLHSDAVVLLDDYERSEEKEIAERWAREFGMTIEEHGIEKPFGLLKFIQPSLVLETSRELDQEKILASVP